MQKPGLFEYRAFVFYLSQIKLLFHFVQKFSFSLAG